MRHRLLALLALLTVFALAVAACGDDTPVETGDDGSSTTTTAAPTTSVPNIDPDSPAARLAAARARWADEGPGSYRLTMRQLCFCPETVWSDTVVDGEVVAHDPVSDDSFFDPGERTMDDLFDEVQLAIDTGFATLDLEFDEETGALVRYWVDVEEMMADEEHGVEVVLGEPVEAGAIDVASLTDDYGCGYGFALGSPAQDLALVIHARGGAPDLATPVVFPTEGWTAELRVGADLFSNWCDDVIDSSEPVPVVDAVWALTGGTLSVDGGADVVEGSGNPVRASLTDALAASPGGDVIELGDLALVNNCYGCFAG